MLGGRDVWQVAPRDTGPQLCLSQVRCCAGLVAHMGPKMLTVHYPGMRPREDNKQQNVQNEHYAAAEKHEAAKKHEAALSTLKCLPDVLFRKKKHTASADHV